MARIKGLAETEAQKFWWHPRFPDLGLFKARFTDHHYDLHTHATYVIALITEGCERIRVGRNCIVAPMGTIAVVNPEEWHDGEQAAEGGWAYRTFYPSVTLFTAIARELGRDSAPIFVRQAIEDRELAGALAMAHEHATAADSLEAETSLLIAFRRLILRHADRGPQREEIRHSGARRRFLLYRDLIEDQLAAELDLQRLADTAQVTRYQVIRDFKSTIGLTPSTYIRDRRLRRAFGLIHEGRPLADSAAMAGFADQSHLCRAFRAAHGMTPGMLRRARRLG